MVKAKKILDWIWIIVKIIFSIALIIVGIKLILWLVFPLFSLWFIPSPFSSFDWNPLTTLLGAIITGGITWYAVYKTSELDKKARIYEFRYKSYIEHLNLLNQGILLIYRLTYYFEKDKEECLISKAITDDNLNKEFEIRSFLKIYEYLCQINKNFKAKTIEFREQIDSFQAVYKFLQDNICEHRWYLQHKQDPNMEKYKKDFVFELKDEKLIYRVDEFLNYYKQKTQVDYDVDKMKKALKDLKEIITSEFKLDKE